jgi:7-cyano-7-deazaguanine synthase
MSEVAMLYSGGLDSFVSAAILLGSGKKVRAMFFDYGQVTAATEWVAARVCVQELQRAYGPTAIKLHRMDMFDYRKHVETYALVGGEAPDASQDGRLTFVPGRNILFLLMTAIATYGDGIRDIAFSSHASDRVAGDCRPEFIEALQEAFRWGFGMKGETEPYVIWSPLQKMTKGEVVAEGTRRGLPLQCSWSCYRPGIIHCGECHNCRDRQEAFREAGIEDKTGYAERKNEETEVGSSVEGR